ncbi:MAG: hypothetical protein [Caudoviricetes sp.]|nr:MAG: hypothetical protein [Caudoviricetes sp.]
MTKDIEREAFEVWFKTTGMYEALVEYITIHQPNLKSAFIKSGKSYRNTMVNTAWLSWLAAKAHEAKKLEGCVVVPVDSLRVAMKWMHEDINAAYVSNEGFVELFNHKPILEKILEDAKVAMR